VHLEEFMTSSNPKRDPRMRIVSCAYFSLIDRNKFVINKSPLVADSAWFEVENNETEIILMHENETIKIPFSVTEEKNGKNMMKNYHASSNDLAFDHGNILLQALMRLRSQVMQSDIVFNLLPEEFSITQLQQIYEIILGEKLLAPAFRRKIAPKIMKTGRFSQEKGHRPSEFYVYKGEEEK
jgi:ADP-ribose pyrophosphatase YjhB (NUDIX family)